MKTISINYTFTHYFKEDHNYRWSECGKLFNIKSGREVRKVYNGGCLGYWINRKFHSLTKLKQSDLVVKLKTLTFHYDFFNI